MTPTAAVVTANRALRGQGAFRRPSASLSLINIGTGATSSVAVAGITGVAVAGSRSSSRATPALRCAARSACSRAWR